MKSTTIVELLRHGEPQGGARIRGQSDDALSELGWRQMWQAVGEHAPWQIIVSSPLLRCADFARALAERHALSLQIENRFKEIGFGQWEGFTLDDLARRDPERHARFRDDPLHFMPPDAEPVTEFVGRVHEAWQNVVAQHAGQRILVVCHAGVIRAVLGAVMAAPPSHLFRVHVEYASLTRIEIPPQRSALLVSHAALLS